MSKLKKYITADDILTDMLRSAHAAEKEKLQLKLLSNVLNTLL